jgi:hypothetical protein
MPNWGRLMSALRNARPRALPAAQPQEPPVFLCVHRYSVDGRDVPYRYDIARGSEAEPIIAFQQYFTEANGNRVRLPQDLRTVPAAGAATVSQCSMITTSGELADA